MAIGKVISGGQTGVDIAGLRAAQWAGIATGGWCPKGWLTELGPRPELLKSFGLRELPTPKYRARTRANVEAGDCTIIIADEMDAGSQFTAQLCTREGKPMLRLTRREISTLPGETAVNLISWIEDRKHDVVNIAGNRESKAPGIEREAEMFLRLAFSAMRG